MLERHRSIPASNHKLLNMVDGGGLAALAAKGNLSYVESLYNPGNFFREVHHFVFNKKDLTVELSNPTLYLHLLKGFSFPPKLRVVASLLWRIVQLVRFVRDHNIDVIRCRAPYQAGLISVCVARITKKPVVVSLGGDNRLSQELEGKYHFGSRLVSYLVEEFVLRNADRVLCPNEFTRKYVIKLGTAPDKTVVVPLMLTPRVFEQQGDGFDVRKETGWIDNPIVLFVGRLTPYKQVDVLVEAVPLVLEQELNTRFIFVGGGELQAQLSQRCKELGIVASVKFMGAQPTERIVDFMRAADIVWIPMAGFVIYEAAAAGKPIVAFDVEWHSEFVETGRTGILVEDRNVSRLAEAMVHLLQNQGIREFMGRNARAKLEEDYDPALSLAKEIEMYESLLEVS